MKKSLTKSILASNTCNINRKVTQQKIFKARAMNESKLLLVATLLAFSSLSFSSLKVNFQFCFDHCSETAPVPMKIIEASSVNMQANSNAQRCSENSDSWKFWISPRKKKKSSNMCLLIEFNYRVAHRSFFLISVYVQYNISLLNIMLSFFSIFVSCELKLNLTYVELWFEPAWCLR